MKKISLIVVIVLVILALGIGGLVITRGRKTPAPSGVKQEPEVEIPIEDQPYVTLTPRSDGREFTLDISGIKNAQTIEYELVYESQGLPRGVVGSIDLEGQTSISRKLLLGTCSRNVCKYDEGVEKGALTLRFRGSAETTKFVSDFHLQQGGEELASIDGKFKLTGKFSPSIFYMTMSTIGLPKEIKGKVVGGPYGVFTSGSSVVKNGRIALTLSEEALSAKLYSWDGESWGEEKKDFEVDGENVSASVDGLATFVAISSE